VKRVEKDQVGELAKTGKLGIEFLEGSTRLTEKRSERGGFASRKSDIRDRCG